MLVKEMREKLRMYRKEHLKPVSLMKKEDVIRELEKYEEKVSVEVKEEKEEKPKEEKPKKEKPKKEKVSVEVKEEEEKPKKKKEEKKEKS